MTMREGARIYAPGGTLLEAGERLGSPGSCRRSSSLADEGARDRRTTGSLAEALLALVRRARRRRHRATTSRPTRRAGREPVEVDATRACAS